MKKNKESSSKYVVRSDSFVLTYTRSPVKTTTNPIHNSDVKLRDDVAENLKKVGIGLKTSILIKKVLHG